MIKNLLEGKKGIIFGVLDEQSIAWHVAKKCVEQGGNIVLTNAPVGFRMGKTKKLADELGMEAIPADATSIKDIEHLFEESMKILGGKIDFILHSIGMSVNIRKKRHYMDLNHDWMLKTLDVSAVSFHKVMQTAVKLDAINEWGSVVAMTYIASQRTFPYYGEMAEAKALLESFARSFGYHLGKHKKVRVNTLSQSPTITTAGSAISGFDLFFNYTQTMAPLGNADGESCGDFCVSLFSDLTKMVTMQNLFNDGGFSSMGMHPDILNS